MSITRQIVKQTTGTADSSLQAFLSNQYVMPIYSHSTPFVFNLPSYSVTGGTAKYYSQDPNSIFTSLSIPYIRFEFTGNTSSLSADTMIIHEVFKVKYDTFKKFGVDFERDVETQEVEESEQTETEQITENGETKTKTTVKSIRSNKNVEAFKKNTVNETNELVNQLTIPFVSYSASTSAITSNFYDFFPTKLIKSTNSDGIVQQAEKLFDDRSQYFVKTYFRFSKNTLDGYFDEQELNENVAINAISITAETPSPQHLFTEVESHAITATTFTGLTVAGNFFSFFEVPNKPTREEPFVEGELTTFSPKFFFSNILDGDEYVLDINYDLLDTGFTGTISSSKIPKSLSEEGIQEFSTSIRTDSNFSYRFGNVKTFNNIFGVAQKVVSYSETYTAKTQTAPANIYVFASSDSPYVADLPVMENPPSLGYGEMPSTYSLSGLVSGSIVTGATVNLTYPNGNTISQVTDNIGFYRFTGLTSGSYQINTVYRGYQTDTREISLSGDTSIQYKLNLTWSNNVDTWGSIGNNVFGDYA